MAAGSLPRTGNFGSNPRERTRMTALPRSWIASHGLFPRVPPSWFLPPPLPHPVHSPDSALHGFGASDFVEKRLDVSGVSPVLQFLDSLGENLLQDIV